MNYLIAIVLAFTFISTSFAKETITVDGGAAPIQNIFRKIEIPFETAFPDYDLIITESGSHEAIRKLDEGKVDLATSGLSPEEWQELSAKNKYPIELAKFQFRALGRDVIKIYISPDLKKIKILSNEELKKIFTGKITNWKDLGGPNTKISVIYGTKIPGVNISLKKHILPDENYVKGIEASDIADVQNKIFKTKGAIGISNNTLLVPQLLSPETKEFGRLMHSATKGMPAKKVQDLLEYIHKDGAAIIEK